VHPKSPKESPLAEPLIIRGRPPRSTAAALLQSQGLPASDITEEHLEHFFFVGSDGSPTGLVGLELYGPDALLEGSACGKLLRQMNTDRIYSILFLCTGNSARSILAESLLKHWGRGKFRAFSAGSFPKGQVHPMAVELLKRMNLPA
jgi:Low molecular weight phosphotyrosine protein phosphatase